MKAVACPETLGSHLLSSLLFFAFLALLCQCGMVGSSRSWATSHHAQCLVPRPQNDKAVFRSAAVNEFACSEPMAAAACVCLLRASVACRSRSDDANHDHGAHWHLLRGMRPCLPTLDPPPTPEDCSGQPGSTVISPARSTHALESRQRPRPENIAKNHGLPSGSARSCPISSYYLRRV